MVAECRFFCGFAGGGFEFEPGCEAGEETAECFEVGSDRAGLGLAGCGFDGHFSAEIAFFEGLQDWVGDEFDLLEPVCAVLLWRVVGVSCVNLREGWRLLLRRRGFRGESCGGLALVLCWSACHSGYDALGIYFPTSG